MTKTPTPEELEEEARLKAQRKALKLKDLTKHPLTAKELKEKYNEGLLAARAFYFTIVPKRDKVSFTTSELEKELKHLQNITVKGNNNDIVMQKNPSRSISILSPLEPGSHIRLFLNTALLYDLDETTVRARMLEDGQTSSAKLLEHPKVYGKKNMDEKREGTKRNRYYNLLQDNKRFYDNITLDKDNLERDQVIATLSNDKFNKTYIEKVKQDKEKKNNPTKVHLADYNEGLANVFPRSLVGIVVTENSSVEPIYSIEHKLELLAMKNFVSQKEGVDLPMTLLKPNNSGKDQLEVYSPDLQDISSLLNDYKKINIERDLANVTDKTLQELAKGIGFDVKITPGKDITPEDLIPLDKNSFTTKEAIKNAREQLNLPDNEQNNTHINEALLKTINDRREKDGEKPIDDISYQIIHKQAIDSLVKSEQRRLNPSLETEITPEPSAASLAKLERNKKLRHEAEQFIPPKVVKPTEYVVGDTKDHLPGEEWKKVGTQQLDLDKEKNLRDNKYYLGKSAKAAWRPDLPDRMSVTNWELSPEENLRRDEELKKLGATARQSNNLDHDQISAITKRDGAVLKEIETTFSNHGISLSTGDKENLAMVWGNAKIEKTPTKLENNNSPLGQDIEQIFNKHHKKLDQYYLDVVNEVYKKHKPILTPEEISKKTEQIFNKYGKELTPDDKAIISDCFIKNLNPLPLIVKLSINLAMVLI